jgi:hypothetical protein
MTDIEALKKRPPLTRTLQPLRHCLGLDCLNDSQLFVRLERLLVDLKKTALEHPGPEAVEVAQMMSLALDLLRTSQATLRQRLAILAEIHARVRGKRPDRPEYSTHYVTRSDIDYGYLIREYFEGQSVINFLIQVGLLGAVYERLPDAEKLLRWLSRQATQPWRVDLQLMLLTAYEGDLAYAYMIFDKRISMHLDAPQRKKIKKEVLPTLEEIHQIRLRFECIFDDCK